MNEDPAWNDAFLVPLKTLAMTAIFSNISHVHAYSFYPPPLSRDMLRNKPWWYHCWCEVSDLPWGEKDIGSLCFKENCITCACSGILNSQYSSKLIQVKR